MDSGVLGKDSGALGKDSGVLGKDSGALGKGIWKAEGKDSGILGKDFGVLGGASGAASERARALERHLRDFRNDLVPWVEKNGRLPRVQLHRGGARRGVERSRANKLRKLEELADQLPADVRQQLEKWRRDEQKAEEAEYWHNARKLNAFLKDSGGLMPRGFRKPKNDDQTKQDTLARFVRKYCASTLPWHR